MAVKRNWGRETGNRDSNQQDCYHPHHERLHFIVREKLKNLVVAIYQIEVPKVFLLLGIAIQSTKYFDNHKRRQC